MIKWILQNYYLLILVPVIVIFLAIKMFISYDNQSYIASKSQKIIAILKALALLCIMIFWCIVISNFHDKYISTNDWKTVYTHDGDVCMSLELDNYQSLSLSKTFTMNTCSRLGRDYSKIERLINRTNNKGHATLETVAIKLGVVSQTDTRSINLSGKNIIIEGELNENSRISKVEYSPISKMKHTLFGYSSGQVDSDLNGELRITIAPGDALPKPKSLFGD